MSGKTKAIWKAVLKFLAYSIIMTAVIYFLNGSEAFSIGNIITLILFLLYGVWQSYRWLSEKLEELNDKETHD